MRYRPLIGLPLAALALVGDAAEAQTPREPLAHLQALATPPDTVGTCLPLPRPDARGWRGRQLVMTSRVPSGRRAITVYVDSTGRVARYGELVSGFDGVDAGMGTTVVAARGPDGPWRGFLSEVATRVADSGREAGGRRRVPPPVRAEPRARRPLSAAEQARVGTLATLVHARCRA